MDLQHSVREAEKRDQLAQEQRKTFPPNGSVGAAPSIRDVLDEQAKVIATLREELSQLIGELEPVRAPGATRTVGAEDGKKHPAMTTGAPVAQWILEHTLQIDELRYLISQLREELSL